MSSVTGRIKEIKQPRGGYINPKQFIATQLMTDVQLNEEENIHASLVGLAVDYLTRLMLGASVGDAFKISILGAQLAMELGKEIGHSIVTEPVLQGLTNITGLDDLSITRACKLVSFDVWMRNPKGALLARTYVDVNPDVDTVHNIRVMVQRSLKFFETYGPVTSDGFTFGDGYTSTVNTGDGDFLTVDTLWDFKVSKAKPKSQHTLQLLMYWIMGQHSGLSVFNGITSLGIYNPRLNCVYKLDMAAVPKEVVTTVETDIICYK